MSAFLSDQKESSAYQYQAMTKTNQFAPNVFHSVSWAKYMDDDAKDIQFNRIEQNKDAFTLSHVFSKNDCNKLIHLSECHGYSMLVGASRGKKYRTNTRMITDDESLCDLLFERIKQFLPKTYKIHGQRWKLCGLNQRFRFCKYTQGQQFEMHCDKRAVCPQYTAEHKASFYTVNIYLNDGLLDYKGGKTLFFNRDYSTGRKWKESSYVIGRPGLALIFNHYPQRYQHSGQQLVSGTKYIFRSDVIYRLQRYEEKNANEDGNYNQLQTPQVQIAPQPNYSNLFNSIRPPPIANNNHGQNVPQQPVRQYAAAQQYHRQPAQKAVVKSSKYEKKLQFEIGEICQLYGLKRMEEMNGAMCKIMGSLNVKEQRYPVCILKTSEQNIWIKPCNLKRTSS